MSFGSFDPSARTSPMAEINTTPLVDVMLVLLIIFIITAPLLTHAVKIDLPAATSEPNPPKPGTVTISINAEGALFWDREPVTEDELERRLLEAAGREPQPELHLRADKGTIYEQLARLMARAQAAGIYRMGFVTEPQAP